MRGGAGCGPDGLSFFSFSQNLHFVYTCQLAYYLIVLALCLWASNVVHACVHVFIHVCVQLGEGRGVLGRAADQYVEHLRCGAGCGLNCNVRGGLRFPASAGP